MFHRLSVTALFPFLMATFVVAADESKAKRECQKAVEASSVSPTLQLLIQRSLGQVGLEILEARLATGDVNALVNPLASLNLLFDLDGETSDFRHRLEGKLHLGRDQLNEFHARMTSAFSSLVESNKELSFERKHVLSNHFAEPDEATKWLTQRLGKTASEFWKSRSLPAQPYAAIPVRASGSLKRSFLTAQSRQGEFHTEDSHYPLVFMHDSGKFEYASRGFNRAHPEIQMVSLPIGDGEEFALDLVLPDKGQSLPNFLRSFSWTQYLELVLALREREVSVRVPRFDIVERAELLPALTRFIGIPVEQLKLTETESLESVISIGSIVFNEAGLDRQPERMAIGDTHERNVHDLQFVANRPFFMVLRHQETGIPIYFIAVRRPGPLGEPVPVSP